MGKIGQSQEEIDNNAKISTLYMGIVVGIMASYMLGYVFSLMETERKGFLDGFQIFMESLMSGHILFSLNANAIKGLLSGLAIGAVSIFFINLDYIKRRHYHSDIVAGSSRFMNEKEKKEYIEKYIKPDPPALIDPKKLPMKSTPESDKGKYSENMIMSNSFCRPINSRALIGNNNVLIVGGAGTGKSRFFIKPNMLQMNASYVITDPSGEMIFSLGKTLNEHGYKVKIFNISDMSHSNCYNPLNYIRDEAGVKMLIECFVTNTTQGEGGGDNQFFVDAEKLLYSACIFYLRDFCHDENKKNLANVLNMINASSVNEQDPNAKSPLDMLFDKLPPSSLAWKYYKAFKQAAGKTLKSIIISCVTRMQPFMTPQVINLTKRDDLELGSIGNEKTVLFIITPQADRTYSFLASMLYSQLFETLYHIGESQKANGESEQLHVPVRCLMDEFANIGEVPEFPSKLATMRKYNISASIVLQDISQIEAMYQDNWKTLVGNCSSIVFLGTQEPNTLKYFSEMLGNMTVQQQSKGHSYGKQKSSTDTGQPTKREVMTADELGRMPANECIVFTQNMRPVKDKKYQYERHPYYSQTADANNDNGFQYNKMSVFNNSAGTAVDSILKAAAEARDYKARQKAKQEMEQAEKPNAESDILRGKERDEERKYKDVMQECIMHASDEYDKPAIVLMVESMPTDKLYRLTEDVAVQIHKFPMIIFTYAGTDTNIIVGIGYGKPGMNMEKIMSTEFNQRVNKKGEYYLTTIYKENFDKYKEAVIANCTN